MAAKPWHGWVMGESIRRVHALRRLAAWGGVYRVKTTTDLSNGRSAEVMKPARYPYVENAKPAAGAGPHSSIKSKLQSYRKQSKRRYQTANF